jgi:Protein of unknown function (DUF3179)
MKKGAVLGWTVGSSSVLAFLLVAVPVVLIRPFSPQTTTSVAVAYHLRTVSPWLAPLAAALVVGLGITMIARRPGPLRIGLLVTAMAIASGAAWLSHQNHFEWMFAPLPSADYARARDVRFVDDADMVVAVELHGDAVAYPVRQMGYHHLLNDQVGGVPVVSTY